MFLLDLLERILISPVQLSFEVLVFSQLYTLHIPLNSKILPIMSKKISTHDPEMITNQVLFFCFY